MSVGFVAYAPACGAPPRVCALVASGKKHLNVLAPAYQPGRSIFDPEPYVCLFPDAPDESPRFEIAITGLQLWCRELGTLHDLRKRMRLPHGYGLQWVEAGAGDAARLEVALRQQHSSFGSPLPWPAAKAYVVDVVKRSAIHYSPLCEPAVTVLVNGERELRFVLRRPGEPDLIIAMRRDMHGQEHVDRMSAFGRELSRTAPAAQVLVIASGNDLRQPRWVAPALAVVPLRTAPIHRALTLFEGEHLSNRLYDALENSRS